MKLNLTFTTTLFALVLLLTFSTGCKKDRPKQDPKDLLSKTWYNPDNSFHQSLEFSKDGLVIFRIQNKTSDELTQLSGNYTVDGNQLKITINKREEIQSGETVTSTTLTAYTIFENCTFKIEGDRLTLKYTSYPADAPQETEVVFYSRYYTNHI